MSKKGKTSRINNNIIRRKVTKKKFLDLNKVNLREDVLKELKTEQREPGERTIALHMDRRLRTIADHHNAVFE